MGKKIVVITGSPRKNGNSFKMTEAFIRKAEILGHTVTRFDAAFKKLGGFQHDCPGDPGGGRGGVFHAGLLVFDSRPDQMRD